MPRVSLCRQSRDRFAGVWALTLRISMPHCHVARCRHRDCHSDPSRQSLWSSPASFRGRAFPPAVLAHASAPAPAQGCSHPRSAPHLRLGCRRCRPGVADDRQAAWAHPSDDNGAVCASRCRPSEGGGGSRVGGSRRRSSGTERISLPYRGKRASTFPKTG